MGQRNSLIRGLIPEYIQNRVALLQFADDTILCLQDDLDNAQNIKFLLYLHEGMSGLKINFDKSEVIMVDQDPEKSSIFSEMFNCFIGK